MLTSSRQYLMPISPLKSITAINLSSKPLGDIIRMMHLMPDGIIGRYITQDYIDRDIESYLRNCNYEQQSVCMLLNVYTRSLSFIRFPNHEMFIKHIQLFENTLNYYQQPKDFINYFLKFKRKVGSVCGQPLVNLPSQVIRYQKSIQFSNFSQIVEQLMQNSQLYEFEHLEQEFLQTMENKIQNFYNNFEGDFHSFEVEYFKNIISNIIFCFSDNSHSSTFLDSLFRNLLSKLPFLYTIINLLKKYGSYHHITSLLQVFIKKNAIYQAINLAHYYLTFFSCSLHNVRIDQLIDEHYNFGEEWAVQLVHSIKPNQVLHPNYMNDEPLMFLIFNKLLSLYNFPNQEDFVRIIMQHEYEPYARKFSKNQLIRESIIYLVQKNASDPEAILSGFLQDQQIYF